MPPLIALRGALGGLAVVRWAYTTAVRINRELEEARTGARRRAARGRYSHPAPRPRHRSLSAGLNALSSRERALAAVPKMAAIGVRWFASRRVDWRRCHTTGTALIPWPRVDTVPRSSIPLRDRSADGRTSCPLRPERSFQGFILALQRFWAEQGCVILQPYDMEMGAGAFHPATQLRALGPKRWNAAYVQPSRRPKDGRYGENPNRLQHYYQFQVIMKPSPPNLQDLYLKSLAAIGIDSSLPLHPLRRGRLGEPDARRVGAGLGVLVRRHGSQPVHLLPAGRGVECAPVAGELTYGLERLAMYVQGVDRVTISTSTAATVPTRSPMATCSCRPSRNIPGTISNTRIPTCCSSSS